MNRSAIIRSVVSPSRKSGHEVTEVRVSKLKKPIQLQIMEKRSDFCCDPTNFYRLPSFLTVARGSKQKVTLVYGVLRCGVALLLLPRPVGARRVKRQRSRPSSNVKTDAPLLPRLYRNAGHERDANRTSLQGKQQTDVGTSEMWNTLALVAE